MACRLRAFLSGSIVVAGLGALAACSGGYFWGEREPWRKEAEARCIGSGAVREGPGLTRINAINGPGMCGADFPFRVASLGVPIALSFGDDLRPPASIPNASRASAPRWPINEPPEGVGGYDPRGGPARPRVDTGPPPRPARSPAPVYQQRFDEPISLDPPQASSTPEVYDYRRPYGAGPRAAPAPVEPAPSSYDLPSARDAR